MTSISDSSGCLKITSTILLLLNLPYSTVSQLVADGQSNQIFSPILIADKSTDSGSHFWTRKSVANSRLYFWSLILSINQCYFVRKSFLPLSGNNIKLCFCLIHKITIKKLNLHINFVSMKNSGFFSINWVIAITAKQGDETLGLAPIWKVLILI